MLEPEPPMSELYRAAAEALVAESSSTSTFTRIAKAGHVFTKAFGFGHVSVFEQELRDVEKVIKEDFVIPAMPPAWRSAKSIILTSMRLGLALIDYNDVPFGKTAMQVAIKSYKAVASDKTSIRLVRVASLLREYDKDYPTHTEIMSPAHLDGLIKTWLGVEYAD